MASQARQAFDRNVKDVERLLEIHADVGGDAQGRRFGLEVLNKSAIVLITAIWEAYCEDLAAEALDHLVANVASGSQLPKELKKKIAADIKADQNDLAMWDLADVGWQTRAKARLASLMVERNRRLNTPKSDQIDELFIAAIGLSSVSSAWRWKKMSVAQARTKLDRFVELRGAIAHRGTAAAGVKKVQVTDYLRHVKGLVGKTGGGSIHMSRVPLARHSGESANNAFHLTAGLAFARPSAGECGRWADTVTTRTTQTVDFRSRGTL